MHGAGPLLHILCHCPAKTKCHSPPCKVLTKPWPPHTRAESMARGFNLSLPGCPAKQNGPRKGASTAHWAANIFCKEKEHGYTVVQCMERDFYRALFATAAEDKKQPQSTGRGSIQALPPSSPRIITHTVRLGNCEVHRTNFNPSLHGCLAKAKHGSKNKASTAHWPAKSGHGCKVAHCTERDPYCTFFAIAPENQNATVHRAGF